MGPALARVSGGESDRVLADEPTDHLDGPAREWPGAPPKRCEAATTVLPLRII